MPLDFAAAQNFKLKYRTKLIYHLLGVVYLY